MKTRSLILLLALTLLASFNMPGRVQAQAPGTTDSGRVTASIEVSRPHVYHNEIFDLTFVIESYGVQLAQEMQLQVGLEKDRLILSDFVGLPEEQSIRNRKVFFRRRFRCTARAIQAGKLVVAPSLRVIRRQRVRAVRGTAWREIPQLLAVKPHTLMVKSIPEKRQPEAWSGAVGVFNLTVNATPTIVSPGDLITLRTEIKGWGYTEGMRLPNVVTVSDFKAYEPKLVSDTEESRIVTQIIIPQSTNAVAVPPMSFCFFDPLRGQFETKTEGPFPLTFQDKTIASVERFTPEEGASGDALPGDTDQDTRESMRRAILALGVGLVVLCGVACGINVFRRRYARMVLWLCGAFLCAGILWGLHSSSLWNPDVLLMARDTAARVAPSPGALICTELSEGADVSIVEQHGAWVRVRHKDSGGWIPVDAVASE
jgi:hypothetical protein